MAARDRVLTAVAGAAAVEEEVVAAVAAVAVIEIARLRLSHGRGGVLLARVIINNGSKADE